MIAPLLGAGHEATTHTEEIKKEIRVEVQSTDDGLMEATIEKTTYDNGKEVVEEKVISGTQEEVEAALQEMSDVEVKLTKEE